VPGEFSRTIGRGFSDRVTFGAHRMAKQHRLRLTFRVVLAAGLPAVTLTPPGGQDGMPVTLTELGIVYDGQAWELPAITLPQDTTYEVRVEPSD
jgi:hypothetical protein